MPLREIAGPAGRLEALLDEPIPAGAIDHLGRVAAGAADGVRAAVVFAHPHTEQGGTMHTKVVYQAAKALSRIGCAVLRFNFRGAGTSAGTFTDGPGEMDDFRAALAFMRRQYPDAKVWAAGMSFGSWIAMSVVTTLVGIAPPVSHYDFEPIAASVTPKFFIQGSHDEICPLKDLRAFYARAAEPKELAVIDGANHLFDSQVGEVADAVEDLLGDWNQ